MKVIFVTSCSHQLPNYSPSFDFTRLEAVFLLFRTFAIMYYQETLAKLAVY